MLSFIIFVAGEQNYEAANYASLPVETDLLQIDPRKARAAFPNVFVDEQPEEDADDVDGDEDDAWDWA